MRNRENKSQITPFPRNLKNESKCIEYLIWCKWSNGYKCRKCGNKNYGKGKKWHHRRCTKCRYDESATAQTLFHKIKFPLTKAFSIVNDLINKEEGSSSVAISLKYRVCQETAWFFKRKVQQAMSRFETKTFGISASKKITVRGGGLFGKNMLIEARWDRVTKTTIRSVSRKGTHGCHRYFASAKSVRQEKYRTTEKEDEPDEKALKEHKLARGALWKRNLIFRSEGDPEMMRQYKIDLEEWVRFTHFHISRKHLFYYCCEFNFRKCKKAKMKIGPEELIQSMVLHPWLRFSRISAT